MTTVRASKTLSRTSIATLIGATRSTGPRRGSRLSQTTSSSRSSRMRSAFSCTSSTAARATCRAPSVSCPGGGLRSLCTVRAVSRTRASARPTESGTPSIRPSSSGSRAAASSSPASSRAGPLSDMPARLLGRGHDHRAGQLVGDGRRDPVDELVRLVDDEHVVLGQHLTPLEGIDRHEGVVGDDDVDVLGGLAGPLDEALRDEGALAAHALVRRHRHLAPRALGDTGDELVAVAGVGARGPLAQPHDLLAEPPRRRVDLTDPEEPLLVVGEAALELVEAHVVAATLDERIGRAAAEDRGEGIGDAGHVAVDDLGLQGEGRRRDDGGLAGLEGVRRPPARGRRATCRCPCRPGRAGARARRSSARRRGPSGPDRAARRHRHLTPRRGGGRRARVVGHWIRVSTCAVSAARGPPTAVDRQAAARSPRPVGARDHTPRCGDSVVPAQIRELYRDMTATLPTDLEIAHAATLRPLVEVAADLGLTEDHLEPWGRDVAKIDLAGPRRAGRGRAGEVRRRHGDHPDAPRRGQDDDLGGSGAGARPTRAARRRRAAAAVDGSDLRHQGRRRGRRLQPGRADGAAQPAPHRRLPRRDGCPQPALRDDRQPPAPRQQARHRRPQHHLAPGDGRQRPGAAHRHRRHRRAGGRARAPDRVRHHRSQRGHGAAHPRDLARGPPAAARPDRRRPTPSRARASRRTTCRPRARWP